MERNLKKWDEEDEDACFDLDTSVTINPEDLEPEYLRGRKRFKTELEKTEVTNINCQPFQSISLFTGQKYGLFKRRQVGRIKGLWKLQRNEESPFGNGLKALVQTRTLIVRLYVLDVTVLVSTDRDNSCDPYLIVKLGDDKVSTRKEYIKNTMHAKFHRVFEFHSTLPGASTIDVQVWDYDGIGDDLVGTTSIDIEDRWFSKDWRRMRQKPLEERSLFNPRSTTPYGKMRCWLDVFTKDEARNIPLTDISIPPPEKFEIRLIVWDAKEVVIKDEITDQNDLRVTCKLKVNKDFKQETDTHWRAKDGKGSWNWRLVFPIELPIQSKTSLHLSMWDRDLFSAADSIGEVNFNLDLLLTQMYLKREDIDKMTLRNKKSKRFYLDMLHTKWPGESQGLMKISLEVLTEFAATEAPAGLGRSAPNQNPFLPPPEGRLIWSLNPFLMLRQLLGDRLYRNLCGIFCIAACCAILIFLGPQIIITLVSNAVGQCL